MVKLFYCQWIFQKCQFIDASEIQPTHCNQSQAILFTMHAWINQNQGSKESIVIISNHLQEC